MEEMERRRRTEVGERRKKAVEVGQPVSTRSSPVAGQNGIPSCPLHSCSDALGPLSHDGPVSRMLQSGGAHITTKLHEFTVITHMRGNIFIAVSGNCPAISGILTCVLGKH